MLLLLLLIAPYGTTGTAAVHVTVTAVAAAAWNYYNIAAPATYIIIAMQLCAVIVTQATLITLCCTLP